LRVRVSVKGQVVIPKEIREALGITAGTVLDVRLEGKRIIMEPVSGPPPEVFVEAGPEVTEPILREAKGTGDKVRRLLEDLGVRE